jgi:hypothetical protein
LQAHRGRVKKNFHREHENQEMEVEDTKNPDYQDTARFTTLQKNANTITRMAYLILIGVSQ